MVREKKNCENSKVMINGIVFVGGEKIAKTIKYQNIKTITHNSRKEVTCEI